MGMKPMDWSTETAAGDDDWRTVDHRGKTGDRICPTYRGRSLDVWLERGRALVDAGVFVHAFDPERHDGEEVCFHPRDLEGFRTYLEARAPALAAAWKREGDPRTWAPAIVEAWGRFKATAYADLMRWYGDAVRAYMRQKGIDASLELFLYASRARPAR